MTDRLQTNYFRRIKKKNNYPYPTNDTNYYPYRSIPNIRMACRSRITLKGSRRNSITLIVLKRKLITNIGPNVNLLPFGKCHNLRLNLAHSMLHMFSRQVKEGIEPHAGSRKAKRVLFIEDLNVDVWRGDVVGSQWRLAKAPISSIVLHW